MNRSAARGRPARAGAAVLCTAICALLLAACGLGVDASPTIVNPKHVPYGLLRPPTPTTSPAVPSQYVTIYLDGPQRLVAVSREVPAPVSPAGVLRVLGQGPTSAEASDGLQSPISTAAPLTLLRIQTEQVTVNMARGFTSLTGEDQALAMAQLVYTLTILPGIKSVSVRIDGRRAKVPTGKGTLSGRPLDRTDYETVAPI
ncbi:MAG: GerMN domain-containing protein [Actinomycetota bacterium]|nr:GerMN domain-containing protein [Actinomycetota bacterium]